ncbi:RNA-directed DNA polymerase from mobile element jockey [Eumeta japonica]|uniref:RNA-directed DNA polymerase from mobile element jockey n=1 Tax=Eumeta variegata TaxID=151549 RepID=A0A4C1XD61_EUMVA|nr:RNA-directed DNA polymerase from mobile element jockey [Eumeta japonica]
MFFCAATGPIFNACIKNYNFPEACKEAVLIGIPKPRKPRDLSTSYRPISLLGGLDKLFEKVLKSRLSDHLLGNGLIFNELFGHEQSTSAKRLITAGVPQGSTFSPLLPRTQFTSRVRKLALFDDDIALYLWSSNFRQITPHLHKTIDELTHWFQTWRIEINPENSAAIFFNYSRIKKKEVVPYNSPTFRICNSPISWHHKYKYLGITLDKHLHFKDHIKRVRKNVQLYLSRLSGKRKMTLRKKCTPYKVRVRSMMTYAAPVFAQANPNILYQLQILHNNFCRRASGAPWYVRNDILHGDLELPYDLQIHARHVEKHNCKSLEPHYYSQPYLTRHPSPPHHFIRRSRNVISDPSDELTTEVER